LFGKSAAGVKVWEHTRISGLPLENIKMEAFASGWQYVSSYGPFNYFKRNLRDSSPDACR
jgi:hypothetical protein